MLRIIPVCAKCRALQEEVEDLRRQLDQERDKRLTGRLVSLNAQRKARQEPTWAELLQQAELILRDHVRSIPRSQREWRVPGNQDLRAVRSAMDSLTGFEGLQQTQRAEYVERLQSELDTTYPGNLVSECLGDKSRLIQLLTQLQEESR